MSATTDRSITDAPYKKELRERTRVLLRRLSTLEPGTAEYSRVRGMVVEANMALVRYVARAYGSRRGNHEDVEQTGVVGLIKAIDAFDVDRGVDFAAYALPTIRGEIKRLFRDTGWAVHVPRGQQERFLAVTRAGDELQQQLGREPTVAELSERLGLSEEEVRDGVDANRAYTAESLDAPDTRMPDGGSLAERLGYEQTELGLVDLRESVRPLIGALGRREKQILQWRFWNDLTQREIGERLGISQMHVSRLLTRTLADLRERIESDGAVQTRRRHAA